MDYEKHYGEWTITGEVPKELRGKERKMYCTCSCGNKAEVTLYRLKHGYSTRCRACRPQSQYQGGKGTKLYNSWRGMRDRVKNHRKYIHLGIDPEWHNFDNFRKWALANGHEEGLTIDRINNARGYFPDNCRWVTRSVQTDNRRPYKRANGLPIGVTLTANRRKFIASTSIKGKKIHIGVFDTANEAALAYNKKILELGFTERPLNKVVDYMTT